jgi:hypothetical protein
MSLKLKVHPPANLNLTAPERDVEQTARQQAVADFLGRVQLQARKSGREAIKRRLHYYLAWPEGLEAIWPSLSWADSTKMLGIVDMLIEDERRTPRRFSGVGGDIKAINLRAVMMLGRLKRFQERKAAQ